MTPSSAPLAPSPRLSVCVIARNEAARIVRCLASVAGVASEIIVVDTGSADDTAVLARAAGAAVSFFPWCDDFAAARNAAIERATGDWILWLDADERLDDGAADVLRPLLADARVLAARVARRNVEREDEPGGVEDWQLRLWRNRPELRFVGRCHPHFAGRLEEIAAREGMGIACAPGVRLVHTGYAAERRTEKMERAARLLELELIDRPGQLYYEIELARTLFALGDARGPEELDQVIGRVLTHESDAAPPSTLAAPVLEAAIRNRRPDEASARRAEALAARWFPDSPPLLDALADEKMRAGAFRAALPLLERIVRLSETGAYDRGVGFDAALLGPDAWLKMGVCQHRLADLNRAEACYRRVLTAAPGHAGATQNLQTLAQQRRLFAAAGAGGGNKRRR